MGKKASNRQTRMPRKASKREAVDERRRFEVETHTTPEEIEEFWSDSCWKNPCWKNLDD